MMKVSDQPRLLGQADADHRHQDHADHTEVGEVVDGRGEDEADAVGREQVLDVHGGRHRVHRRVLQHVRRHHE